MAKNFGNAIGGGIANVAKLSEVKGKVVSVKTINTDSLYEYPNNNEDTTAIADLVASIKANGFTTPIEVTTAGAPNNGYFVISGNRRVAAAKSLGYKDLPCIVKDFEATDTMTVEQAVEQYVLSANATRDSSKDPLLMPKRFRKWAAFFKSLGKEKGVVNLIAERMGISASQCARYEEFCKLIPEFWELVSNDEAGISSLVFASKYSEAQQKEVYDILVALKDSGVVLTRPVCKDVFNKYDTGAKTVDEIKNIVDNVDDNHNITITENNEDFEAARPLRSDEVRRERDVIADDEAAAERKQKAIEAEKPTAEDYATIEAVSKNKKEKDTNDISLFSNFYSKVLDVRVEEYDKEKAREIIKTMGAIVGAFAELATDFKEEFNTKDIDNTCKIFSLNGSSSLNRI